MNKRTMVACDGRHTNFMIWDGSCYVEQGVDYIKKKPQELTGLLLELKCAAIDPGNPKALSEGWSQLLTARRMLFKDETDIYSKKRKLQHLLKQTPLLPTCGFPQKKQNVTRLKEHQIPEVCLGSEAISCADSQESSKKKTLENTYSSQNFSQADVVLIHDSCDCDDSTSCSNEWSSSNSVSCTPVEVARALESSYNLPINQVTNSSILGDDPRCCSSTPPLRSLSPILISDDSADTLSTSVPRKIPPRRSGRLMDYIGESLQPSVIPVGDHFQADIPDCTGPPGDEYMLESSKWLGQRIWPIEGGNNMDTTNMKPIGKGRPDSLCSCNYPHSTECINYHIHDERCRLLFEIGDAYFTWGFDKMGEVVSDTWTLKEQNTFKILFQRKTTLSKESFWKRAFNHLPLKCRESIVSYYFNVFVLRNVRRLVRMRCPVIDSDDDEADNNVCKSKTSTLTWLR